MRRDGGRAARGGDGSEGGTKKHKSVGGERKSDGGKRGYKIFFFFSSKKMYSHYCAPHFTTGQKPQRAADSDIGFRYQHEGQHR